MPLANTKTVLSNGKIAIIGPPSAVGIQTLPSQYRVASETSGVGYFTHDGAGVTFHDIFNGTITAIRLGNKRNG